VPRCEAISIHRVGVLARGVRRAIIDHWGNHGRASHLERRVLQHSGVAGKRAVEQALLFTSDGLLRWV
jgi:hypothetical protein